MRLAVVVALVLTVALVACAGGEKETGSIRTSTPGSETPPNPELDSDPSLPGQYIDIPALYGGEYPNDAKHVTTEVDYSPQGLPPVGGPHWGIATCPTDPDEAQRYCGPVQWGIYRKPWPAASVVHNMEHGGVVIWYNTTNQELVRGLEQHIVVLLNDDRLLVMLPYPELPAETIAITAWTRRDQLRVSEYSLGRVDAFIDAHERRFNPERL